MADDHEKTALSYQDKIACMSDDELRALYLWLDAKAGDPWGDALALACQERHIDL